MTEPQAEEVEHKEVRLAVDPNDPEVQAAASKIQAGFRGMHTRRELKRMREVGSAVCSEFPHLALCLHLPIILAHIL